MKHRYVLTLVFALGTTFLTARGAPPSSRRWGPTPSAFGSGLSLARAAALEDSLSSRGPQALQDTRPGADWPQWQGPDRNGLSKETGLLKQWPASGPPLVWTVSTLGSGYGSVAVNGDRIFIQGSRGRDSVVFALNRADGKGVWSKALGQSRDNEQGPGARGTPTVDGDRLYVLTENGDLACLKTQDGTAIWQRNILSDFGARNIPWLISESPLVDGNMVIVTPGGRGAGIVALDKMSGKTIWTSKELSDEAGYASCVVADVQGIRTVMTLTAGAGVGSASQMGS